MIINTNKDIKYIIYMDVIIFWVILCYDLKHIMDNYT